MRRALSGSTAIPVCAALGVGAAALALAVPTDSLDTALGIGVRVALGAWCLTTLYGVLSRQTAMPSDLLERVSGRHALRTVVMGTVVLLVVALQRSPSRLAANLLGYALLVTPVVWLAQRRAGRRGATLAAAAVGVFVFLPTHVDQRAIAGPDATQAETPFIWTVGWPSPDWVLRHELVVPPHLAGRKTTLTALLGERYTGDARVRVAANGRGLGEALFAGERGVYVSLPAELARAGEALSFELRLAPFDRRLRLLAHRWAAGASRGASASAYYDTLRWWPGTFDDLAGGPRGGSLMISLGRAD